MKSASRESCDGLANLDNESKKSLSESDKSMSLAELQGFKNNLSNSTENMQMQDGNITERESFLDQSLMDAKHRISKLEEIIAEERMEKKKMEAGFLYTKEELLGKLKTGAIEQSNIDLLDSLIERMNMAFYNLEKKSENEKEEKANKSEGELLKFQEKMLVIQKAFDQEKHLLLEKQLSLENNYKCLEIRNQELQSRIDQLIVNEQMRSKQTVSDQYSYELDIQKKDMEISDLKNVVNALRCDLKTAEKHLLTSESNFLDQMKEFSEEREKYLERDRKFTQQIKDLVCLLQEKQEEIEELRKERTDLLNHEKVRENEQAEWKRYYNLEISSKMKRLEEELVLKSESLEQNSMELGKLKNELREEKDRNNKLKQQYKEEIMAMKTLKKKEQRDFEAQSKFTKEKISFLQDLSDRCCSDRHVEQITSLIEQNAQLLNQQVVLKQKEGSLRTEMSVIIKERAELEETLLSMQSLLESEREKRNLLNEKLRELDRQAALNFRRYLSHEEEIDE